MVLLPISFIVESGEFRIDHGDRRVQIQQTGLYLELVRVVKIVRIKESDVFPTGHPHADIPCGCRPAVPCTDIPYLLPVRLDPFRGVIHRTVVNHDDLMAIDRLPEHAVDRLLQKLPPVVGGDDDADLHHFAAIRFLVYAIIVSTIPMIPRRDGVYTTIEQYSCVRTGHSCCHGSSDPRNSYPSSPFSHAYRMV